LTVASTTASWALDRAVYARVLTAGNNFCATVGQMTEEMINLPHREMHRCGHFNSLHNSSNCVVFLQSASIPCVAMREDLASIPQPMTPMPPMNGPLCEGFALAAIQFQNFLDRRKRRGGEVAGSLTHDPYPPHDVAH
jgi:hypothetical protein